MVEYNYDAWGNFVAEKVREACIGSVTVDLAELNAFTYRGYYYDKESGLYYLINRYYDPVTGRFISPDISDVCGCLLYRKNKHKYISMISPKNEIAGILNTKRRRNIRNSLLEKNVNASDKALFGWENRKSDGWESSSLMLAGRLGRIGFSSYTTKVSGNPGVFYSFYGATSDMLNWFETTYYAGVGVNVFDVIGMEVQFETAGVGVQVSIGSLFISTDINVIGGTTLTVGRNIDLGDGIIQTNGVTIGLNTGLLVAVLVWIYQVVLTGNPAPVPGLA